MSGARGGGPAALNDVPAERAPAVQFIGSSRRSMRTTTAKRLFGGAIMLAGDLAQRVRADRVPDALDHSSSLTALAISSAGEAKSMP